MVEPACLAHQLSQFIQQGRWYIQSIWGTFNVQQSSFQHLEPSWLLYFGAVFPCFRHTRSHFLQLDLLKSMSGRISFISHSNSMALCTTPRLPKWRALTTNWRQLLTVWSSMILTRTPSGRPLCPDHFILQEHNYHVALHNEIFWRRKECGFAEPRDARSRKTWSEGRDVASIELICNGTFAICSHSRGMVWCHQTIPLLHCFIMGHGKLRCTTDASHQQLRCSWLAWLWKSSSCGKKNRVGRSTFTKCQMLARSWAMSDIMWCTSVKLCREACRLLLFFARSRGHLGFGSGASLKEATKHTIKQLRSDGVVAEYGNNFWTLMPDGLICFWVPAFIGWIHTVQQAKSAVVCRHWKSKGWCRLGDECRTLELIAVRPTWSRQSTLWTSSQQQPLGFNLWQVFSLVCHCLPASPTLP